MLVLPRRIEHPLDVAIQCPHHAYPGQHRWPVMFGNQQQRLHRGLPFFGIVFCLGQFGDVKRGVAHYIMKLPKAEQQATPWQTAAEVLMLIGEHGGDPMMAHIAMMRALHRHKPKAAPAARRKRAKVYRIVR